MRTFDITYKFLSSLLWPILLISTIGCDSDVQSQDTADPKVVSVNPDYFIKESLLEDISQQTVDLNGTQTLCYVIKTKSQPTEHPMGPWCPRTIEEGKERGGIWFENGNVYDVDGHFIADLAEFYNDDKWKLYREDGTIKVTDTQEACEGAAKPDVVTSILHMRTIVLSACQNIMKN